MIRPIDNTNINNVKTDSVGIKPTSPDNISIMSQVNETTKGENTNAEDIKISIQEKKNRIEYLKTKMAPKKSSIIEGASIVAGGAISGNIAIGSLLTKGIAMLSLTGIGIVGAAVTVGAAIGYFAGKAIANYNENKCQKEIETLEQEIQVLEQQLNETSLEV